jgi:hypothetical protein
MRYEQAVRTTVVFHTQRPPYTVLYPEPETVVIGFEGRRFVWHAPEPSGGEGGEERFPTVTTTIENANDYSAERLAMERFLSAVSWWTEQAIEWQTAAGAGVPQEMDPPVATALRRGLGNHLFDAPGELVVEDDPALRRVLGYHREGLNTGSPFFKFLAFWNALDIACDNYPDCLRGWIRTNVANYEYLRNGDEPPPNDWWDHLHNERRSAVSHATRDRPGLEIDPDDPEHQAGLECDGNFLRELARIRVRERWGIRPVWQRRRRD